ncbi:MAG: pyridoxine 4-dehydrogenase [Solirubrobacterales bacterium]|nr:pyridoxine 4-dehydrogenase [Solirubrobacterales bacterium]
MPSMASERTIALGERTITRIGLGSNRLTDTPENRAFLQGAVEAGIDHVDTAHLYTGGGSEATIGAALAPFPGELTVATKGGYHPGGGPANLRAELEESYARLQADTIALYYVHRVDPDAGIEAMLEPLAEAREAGRIENVGISEVSVAQIELARTVVPIAAVQNEYSMGEGKHADVLEYCEAEGIVFVPFFPLRGGDREALAEVAARHDATVQQVKLAWLLRRSPAIAPIPGSLSLEHVRENLAALDLELSDQEFEALSHG